MSIDRNNRVSRKPSAAEMLRGALARTPRKEQKVESDTFSEAVGRRLQDRGIATVPGLPEPEEPAWYDKAIAHDEAAQRFEAQRAAAAEQHTEAQKSAAEAIRDALARSAGKSSSDIPLNGAGVLKRALGGVNGTINGQ